ncbi:hypothetical protein DFH08DRAFT_808478 [Mycena albidolilacea]|uniref:Uncharacterized protein n=1 Tax=Mycena albidolilacea TaxID=1033008 RepID=A0AAD7A2N1_9AGAR|nr:hypothetical protein DFH08DRAFT_808478 [Mycena albidolilacea]
MGKKRKRKTLESSGSPNNLDSDLEIPAKIAKRSNQHLPCPDEEDLVPLVEYYWQLGFNDTGIATHCLDHFERDKFRLSAKSIQRLRKKLGLKGARQQAATFDSITPFYEEIRERFPTMGARMMVSLLRQDYGIKVGENKLAKFLKEVEPDAVRQRRAFKFKRKRFYSAGVMDLLCFDQHDKWKRFGLWLHLGMDPYPGRLHWLKIWWTNRNPKLVTRYYLDACRNAGEILGIPLVTQSDLGSENNGIANCHTVTRVARGLYDINNPLEKLVFRWLAIPWLQAELDAWVIVPPELFDEMEQQWAPADDPVFELAPPVFSGKIQDIYESLGRPKVTSRSFWDVYSAVLNHIIQVDEDLTIGHDEGFSAIMELVPGQDLRENDNVLAGYNYYGGLPEPPQLGGEDSSDEEDHRCFADLTGGWSTPIQFLQLLNSMVLAVLIVSYATISRTMVHVLQISHSENLKLNGHWFGFADLTPRPSSRRVHCDRPACKKPLPPGVELYMLYDNKDSSEGFGVCPDCKKYYDNKGQGIVQLKKGDHNIRVFAVEPPGATQWLFRHAVPGGYISRWLFGEN